MIRILFVAANPSDTTRLRLDEEIRSIDEKLRLADYREEFHIEQHWAVRVGDVQGLLLRHKPDIVNFSGHGNPSSEIILENNFGISHSVSTRALKKLFSIFSDDIRCVVLNACYSEKQAQAIAEHIDYVIGMTKAITDQASISFITAFYQALGYGKDVRSAFDSGCVQLDLENLGEQDTPRLIAKKNVRREIADIVQRQTGLKVVDVAVIDNQKDVKDFRRMWFGEIDDHSDAIRKWDEKFVESHNRYAIMEEKSAFPVIDIKLRNVSNSPVFLKAVEFDIHTIKVLPAGGIYATVPVSWEYNVLFNPFLEKDKKTLNISQVVEPSGVDRFVIVIGHDSNDRLLNSAIYEIELKLLYNEDLSVKLGEFKIEISSPLWSKPQRQVAIRKLPLAQNL